MQRKNIERKDKKQVTCDYFHYREMMDKLFYGVALTDRHLNEATEQIRQYLVNGGAEQIMANLGIGLMVITKEATLLPKEVTYRRFVWITGERKGAELNRAEIEGIGMFLKHGALYGKTIT